METMCGDGSTTVQVMDIAGRQSAAFVFSTFQYGLKV